MVTSTLVEDRDTGTWLVALRGSLTLPDAADVVAVVEKCLAQCPAAIVVDLHGLTGFDDMALSILPTLQRRAALVEVPLVYTGNPELAARHSLPVHPTAEDGRASATAKPGRRWLRRELAAGPLTSSTARDVVGEACIDWGLRSVLHPARMIVGELVDNAVEHARTAVEITVGVLAEHLHIRVRDGSTTVPVRLPFTPRRPDAPLDLRGRGVRLLDRHAARWGTVRQPNGKIVWATLLLSGKER